MQGADIVGRPRAGALLLIAGGSRLGVGGRRAVDTGPMARGRRLGRKRWPGWGLAAGTGETELRAGSANFRRLLPEWGAARPDRQEHVIILASTAA